MGSLPAERKVLLFTVGHVRFALRLSQVREIVSVPGDAGEVTARGVAVPALPVAVALELSALFTRGGRTYGVPVRLLAQVLEAPAVFPVPLAPSAHRGLLHHGRAIHPVFDVPVLYGEPAAESASTALLVEEGKARHRGSRRPHPCLRLTRRDETSRGRAGTSFFPACDRAEARAKP
jgi:chemotaxis signal transduction protein